MKRSTTLFGAALLALAPSATAHAQAPKTLDDDLRCLIVTSSLAEAEEEEVRLVGLVASTFFMGKIFGENPDIDIKSALEAAARQFDWAAAQSLLQECGQEMEQRGSQVREAGEHLNGLGL